MKNRTCLILLMTIVCAAFFARPTFAQEQPRFRIPVMVTDTGWNGTLDTVLKVRNDTILFGVHPNATDCLDDTVVLHGFTDRWFSSLHKEPYTDSLLEEELPPLEPSPHPWRTYFTNTTAGCDLGNGQWYNIHKYNNGSQSDTFVVNFLVDESDGGTSYGFTWPNVLSDYCDSIKLLKPNPLGAPTLAANMITSTKYVIKKTKTPISKLLLVMWHPKVPPPAAVFPIQGSGTPKRFSLAQNYPNPFNPTTTIEFNLPSTSVVTLKVYNLLGQEVASLLNGQRQNAGRYNTRFDANTLASGIYFYRLDAVSASDPGNSFTQLRKMMLLR